MNDNFHADFAAITGNAPFPWQKALYERFVAIDFPSTCNIPTGLGKTGVIPVWLIALANAGSMPRRLVYVVNRRTVVDQATREAEKLRDALQTPELAELKSRLQRLRSSTTEIDGPAIAISTLRGQFADNREWSADPARSAVIVGTVDMIGSRLLFSAYGAGYKLKPLHAGFLGQDVLLVHDEAHLEPAFQKLLTAIENEQREANEYKRLRVLEMSATSRGSGSVLELTEADLSHPIVKRRIDAKKKLTLHENKDEKKLADEIANLALGFRDSGRAVIVFVRKVEDVEKVVGRLRKEKLAVQQLTGTLRGLERDRMADPRKPEGCPIFARYLPPPHANAPEDDQWRVEPQQGTVYLVCTSAGEVGVNISADHLICDLPWFDSIAQRLGRVNRFGDREDTEVHLVYPSKFEDDDSEQRRKNTKELLDRLNGDGSPKALSELPLNDRLAAFAPTPTILQTSDILFDTWALTSIRGKLPGRPPVEPYLHGISDTQLPETFVAWRKEVELVSEELLEKCRPEDLLEDYPLKPHELLRDRSDRVFKHLVAMSQRRPEAPCWLFDDEGTVQRFQLSQLADKDAKDRIYQRTLLLPPTAGGLDNGMLASGSLTANDVADEWYDDERNQRRRRLRSDEVKPERIFGMRLIREIDLRPDEEESEFDEESENGELFEERAPARAGRYWRWYVRPLSADDDGSKTALQPMPWEDHTQQVEREVTRFVRALGLPKDLQNALILAARFHDLGKKRPLWQRSIGNPNPTSSCYAKSGKSWKPIEVTDYRHEFGSLLDIERDAEFLALTTECQDLVLHVVAAHHGRGRPHFQNGEDFDPEYSAQAATQAATQVPRRFARLQRQYGRWGLAYLESLLRAADYAASARPTAREETEE